MRNGVSGRQRQQVDWQLYVAAHDPYAEEGNQPERDGDVKTGIDQENDEDDGGKADFDGGHAPDLRTART